MTKFKLCLLALIVSMGCSSVRLTAPSKIDVKESLSSSICASNPPYGGNDVDPPRGGCYGPGVSLERVIEIISAQPQYTWGRSGKGYAYPEQLPDGTWHVAVSR